MWKWRNSEVRNLSLEFDLIVSGWVQEENKATMALEETQNGTVVQQKEGAQKQTPQMQPSSSSEKLNALANGTNEKARNNNKQVG